MPFLDFFFCTLQENLVYKMYQDLHIQKQMHLMFKACVVPTGMGVPGGEGAGRYNPVPQVH